MNANEKTGASSYLSFDKSLMEISNFRDFCYYFVPWFAKTFIDVSIDEITSLCQIQHNIIC